MRDRPLVLGSLVVILAASGFGILGPLSRYAYAAGHDPLTFVLWRAIFGCLVIVLVGAVLVARGQPLVNPLRLPRDDAAGLLVVGLAGLGLNAAVFFAFQLTSVAVALLAFYTYPALVAVVAAALGHERLDGTRVAALVLALAGMVLVVAMAYYATVAAVRTPLGVVMGLLAAAGQTVFVTVSRSRFTAVPPVQAMGWIIAVTAAGCVVAAVVAGSPVGIVVSHPDALVFAAIAGFIGAVIPSVLFLTGIRAIGGTRAGILMLFEPLVGVTLAALILREALSPVQLVGGAAILGAALLIQRSAAANEVLEPPAVAAAEAVAVSPARPSAERG